MADLLSLSERIIDQGIHDVPTNRITQELSEVADGIAVIESFSHVVVFRTEAGLVVFDTSHAGFAPAVMKSLRTWSDARVDTLLYTHGHIDHVGGAGLFVEEAKGRGEPEPNVVGHENVAARFRRYDLSNGYNLAINARQFGGLRGSLGRVDVSASSEFFLPRSTPAPDVTFLERLRLEPGGLELDLRHALGETDDHLWAWIPERKAICAGDFFIWNFPNAGNPQKVQRYPLEWAAALREMAGLESELFLPAHGLPIAGRERIRSVLVDTACVLETLVERTLEMMNAGEPLDAVLQGVKLDSEVLEKPYLRPLYDEPEFVIRNIWRLYGGWYDGNPAHLKPAPAADLAAELSVLAGGVDALIHRAEALAQADDLRLACHLIELAVQAEPEHAGAHSARAEIYRRRRSQATSLMAKGIYGHASRSSAARLKGF